MSSDLCSIHNRLSLSPSRLRGPREPVFASTSGGNELPSFASPNPYEDLSTGPVQSVLDFSTRDVPVVLVVGHAAVPRPQLLFLRCLKFLGHATPEESDLAEFLSGTRQSSQGAVAEIAHTAVVSADRSISLGPREDLSDPDLFTHRSTDCLPLPFSSPMMMMMYFLSSCFFPAFCLFRGDSLSTKLTGS